MKNKVGKLDIIALPLIAVAILFDQLTKYWAKTYIKVDPITVVKGVFELRYLENRGAAFGILQNQQWMFLIIGVILMLVMTYVYLQLPTIKRFIPLKLCLLLIVAGAIGNMIDRVMLNYVIDFLHVSLINFPIFNVADIFVSCSTMY